MGRCTDRRDMTKAVESGVKLQTNKQTKQIDQECVFEDFNLKRAVVDEIVTHMPSTAIIASSTGSFLPSRLSEGLDRKERIIVAHPV